jgi:hypothetical protein
MPTSSVEIYQSLLDAMVARCKATGEALRHFVSRALSDALGLDHATLFRPRLQRSRAGGADGGSRRSAPGHPGDDAISCVPI